MINNTFISNNSSFFSFFFLPLTKTQNITGAQSSKDGGDRSGRVRPWSVAGGGAAGRRTGRDGAEPRRCNRDKTHTHTHTRTILTSCRCSSSGLCPWEPTRGLSAPTGSRTAGQTERKKKKKTQNTQTNLYVQPPGVIKAKHDPMKELLNELLMGNRTEFVLSLDTSVRTSCDKRFWIRSC